MKSQRGVTLVELVVSIVIIGIAASTVLGVFATTSASSADPMIRHQAAAIAEAYLEEIRLRAFDDPDGSDSEASRVDFDDVDDYDGLTDVGARDQFGNAIAGLSDYTVSVTVNNSSGRGGIASGDVLRIDVLVARGSDISYRVSAYRTDY